jgi:hypothetical protein
MAKLISYIFKCPVCGTEFQDDYPEGLGENCRVGLDSNTYEDEQFNQIIMCPKCGYSASNYLENEDKKVIDFVNSSEYQLVVNSDKDPIYKKWMLAGYISKLIGNDFDAGYSFMVAGWYARKFTQNIDDFYYSMELAVSELSVYVNETGYVKAALMIVDLLRQMTRLQDAADYALELRDFELDEKANAFIEFVLQMISKLELSEHYIDEVY